MVILTYLSVFSETQQHSIKPDLIPIFGVYSVKLKLQPWRYFWKILFFFIMQLATITKKKKKKKEEEEREKQKLNFKFFYHKFLCMFSGKFY